jgi:MFS family permease
MTSSKFFRLPVRYRVVGFAASLAALTYLDRVCISILAPDISEEFQLSKQEMSYVFSAFTLSYALFEIPTAWWADQIGSRRVVARIVTWWSTFTILTGAAFNYASLLACRFLFGVGEAGAWPNAARVFSHWIPFRERGMVQGIFFAGAHISGGLTPLLVQWMNGHMSWRSVFIVCGIVGLFWPIAWYRWYRDEPTEHPGITPEERDMIMRERMLEPEHAASKGAYGRLARHPSTYLLCAMYIANAYGFYFLISWLPTYLQEARGFASTELAVFAGLPLMLSVVADLFGGYTTDALCKRFGLRFGRASVGFVGYAIAAVATILAANMQNNRLSAITFSVAAASSMFTLAPSWATCIDIGGRYSAVLSAAMNTSGNLGGFLSPIVAAFIVETWGDWSIALGVLAGLYLMAAVCWLFIRPDRPIKAPA